MNTRHLDEADFALLTRHLRVVFGGCLEGDEVARIRLATEVARFRRCSVQEGDAVVELLAARRLVVRDAQRGMARWLVLPGQARED